MEASEFTRLGETLYRGRGWQAALAAALGVNRATVWRWSENKMPIPTPVALAMRTLQQQRIKEIENVETRKPRRRQRPAAD